MVDGMWRDLGRQHCLAQGGHQERGQFEHNAAEGGRRQMRAQNLKLFGVAGGRRCAIHLGMPNRVRDGRL
jgi:hypothetical protein